MVGSSMVAPAAGDILSQMTKLTSDNASSSSMVEVPCPAASASCPRFAVLIQPAAAGAAAEEGVEVCSLQPKDNPPPDANNAEYNDTGVEMEMEMEKHMKGCASVNLLHFTTTVTNHKTPVQVELPLTTSMSTQTKSTLQVSDATGAILTHDGGVQVDLSRMPAFLDLKKGVVVLAVKAFVEPAPQQQEDLLHPQDEYEEDEDGNNNGEDAMDVEGGSPPRHHSSSSKQTSHTPTILLHLVNSHGMILSLRFTLVPASSHTQYALIPHYKQPAVLYHVQHFLQSFHQQQQQHQEGAGGRRMQVGIQLQSSSQVAFLHHDACLMAVPSSSYLVCISLSSKPTTTTTNTTSSRITPWCSPQKGMYNPTSQRFFTLSKLSSAVTPAKVLGFVGRSAVKAAHLMLVGQREDEFGYYYEDDDDEDESGEEEEDAMGGRRLFDAGADSTTAAAVATSSAEGGAPSTVALCVVQNQTQRTPTPTPTPTGEMLVFTLHANGTLYKWTHRPHSTTTSTTNVYPQSVTPLHLLTTPSQTNTNTNTNTYRGASHQEEELKLPAVTLWRTVSLSGCLTSCSSTRTQDHDHSHPQEQEQAQGGYVLAVSIQTSIALRPSPAVSIPSNRFLVTLTGSVQEKKKKKEQQQQQQEEREVSRGVYLPFPPSVDGMTCCSLVSKGGGEGEVVLQGLLETFTTPNDQDEEEEVDDDVDQVTPSTAPRKRTLVVSYPLQVSPTPDKNHDHDHDYDYTNHMEEEETTTTLETSWKFTSLPSIPQIVHALTMDQIVDHAQSLPLCLPTTLKTTVEVDGYYLTKLIRPTTTMTGGSMPGGKVWMPAIKSLCPSTAVRTLLQSLQGGRMSTPGQILGAVREWARVEEAAVAKKRGIASHNVGDKKELQLQSQLQRHARRWRRFLRAVWEEEARSRRGLLLVALPPSQKHNKEEEGGGGGKVQVSAVVVRQGLSSALCSVPPRGEEEHSSVSYLDGVALALVSCRENAKAQAKDKILALQEQVGHVVSTGILALVAEKAGNHDTYKTQRLLQEEMASVGRIALRHWRQEQEEEEAEFSLLEVVQSTPARVLAAWASGVWGLEKVSKSLGDMQGHEFGSGSGFGSGSSASSAYLAQLYTQHAQQLALGRCLLLFGLASCIRKAEEDDVDDLMEDEEKEKVSLKRVIPEAALRSYLLLRAMQWVASQKPPLQRTASTGGSRLDHPLSVSPFANRATAIHDMVGAMRNCLAASEADFAVQVVCPLQCFETILPDQTTAFNTPEALQQGYQAQQVFFNTLEAMPLRLALRVLAPLIGYPTLVSGKEIGSAGMSLLRRTSLYKVHVMAAKGLLQEAAFGSKHGTLSKKEAQVLRDRAVQVFLQQVGCEEDMEVDGGKKEADKDVLEKSSFVCGVLLGDQDPTHEDASLQDSSRDPIEDALVTQLVQRILVRSAEGTNLSAPSSPILLSLVADSAARLLDRLPSYRVVLGQWVRRQAAAMFQSRGRVSPISAEDLGQVADSLLDELLQQLEEGMTSLTADGGGVQGLDPSFFIGEFIRGLVVVEHGISLLDFVERNCADHQLMLHCAQEAISRLQAHVPSQCGTVGQKESATLHSVAFRHATRIGQWTEAFFLCQGNPAKSRRESDFRRLVVTMVESGHVGTLLALSQRVEFTGVAVDGSSSMETIDLYETAALALYEKAAEWRHHRATGTGRVGAISGSAVDGESKLSVRLFIGCLFSLHVSRGEWRRAARAMNDWFETTMEDMTELRITPANNETNTPFSDRVKAQILREMEEDALLGAVGCALSMQMVLQRDKSYLFAGECAETRASHLEILNRLSDEGDATMDVGGNRISRLRTDVDLDNTALCAIALRALGEGELAILGLAGMISSPPYQAIIERLFKSGYNGHAVTLAANAMSRDEDFSQVLTKILVTHVIPASVQMSRPAPTNGPADNEAPVIQLPTIGQVYDASASCQTSLYGGGPQTGICAMQFLEGLVQRYASSQNTIAVSAASTLLDVDHGRAALPPWIVNLLVTGSTLSGAHGPLDGLFAVKGKTASAANPSALLRLYMERGLYAEACDLVTLVLMGNDGGERRKQGATKRLPEKGSIDYVPYSRIDLLFRLVEKTMASPGMNDAARLENACEKMKNALQFHFELMALSEMGQESARVLSTT